MPRTRSAASPPPRRSGAGERSRSVRTLTHRPKKLVKKAEAKEVIELPADPKQRLILQHAEARAERHQTSFGPVGMVAVAATCLLIFVAWWLLPDFFSGPEPIVPEASVSAPVNPMVRFVPLTTTSSTATQPTTTTERRLLLPLTSPTSTDSSR